MKLEIINKRLAKIDNAQLMPSAKNFSGAPGRYNKSGDRNFLLVFDPETDEDIIEGLRDAGYNVKDRVSKKGDEYCSLKVNVRFNRDTSIYLKSGKRVRKLTENNVGILDRTYIVDASVLLNPYRRTDEVTGETTQTAYLKSISVEKDVDPIREDLEDLGYDIDEDENDIYGNED